MDKFQEVKIKATQVLMAFCQVDEDETAPLDELDIDILSDALAQALSKGCTRCESK